MESIDIKKILKKLRDFDAYEDCSLSIHCLCNRWVNIIIIDYKIYVGMSELKIVVLLPYLRLFLKH